MSLKELLKNMIRDYFVITTAILMCTIAFCSIFNPDAVFTLQELRALLLLGIATDLPTLIYYSKRELSEREYKIRFVLQVLVIASIVIFVLCANGWVDGSNLPEMLVVAGEVCAVAALVKYGFWRKDKRLSDKINERLSEIRDSDEM